MATKHRGKAAQAVQPTGRPIAGQTPMVRQPITEPSDIEIAKRLGAGIYPPGCVARYGRLTRADTASPIIQGKPIDKDKRLDKLRNKFTQHIRKITIMRN